MRTYYGIGGHEIEMANPYSMAMQLERDILACAGRPAWVDLLLKSNAGNIKWIKADKAQGKFWHDRITAAAKKAREG
jgi:hypothetical protein